MALDGRRGVTTYNGKFYTNVYFGSYDTVAKAVSIRERALEFKASLKDVALKVIEPAPIALAKKKGSKKEAAAAA